MLAAWMAVVGTACSTVYVPVVVMRPAEIDLHGKRELVLHGFDGEGGVAIEARLKDQVARSGYLKLVERRNLDRVMAELQLSTSELASTESRKKLGQLMTGSIMVTCRLDSYGYEEKVDREERKCKRTKDKKEIEYTCYDDKRRGEAKVSAGFDVVDIETGENIAPKFVQCLRVKTTSENSEKKTPSPPSIDGSSMVSECADVVVSDFLKAIMPWKDTVQAPFQKTSELPELEQGIEYAKNGQWPDAVQRFRDAVEKASQAEGISPKDRAKAHFDLALAYEYTSRFDEAVEQAKLAYELTSDTDYLDEVPKIETRRAEEQRLKQQQAGKPGSGS